MDEKMNTIADVIDLAINKYLWDGSRLLLDGSSVGTYPIKSEYSCAAVRKSRNYADSIKEIYDLKEFNFLRSLGCNTSSSQQFEEIDFGEKRQYARALWLTWAAMIAREEETK